MSLSVQEENTYRRESRGEVVGHRSCPRKLAAILDIEHLIESKATVDQHHYVDKPSHCIQYWSWDAMAAVMATPEIRTAKGTAPNPSRNPLPLSASQESQVRELYYKRVRQKCADEVRGMKTHHVERQPSDTDTLHTDFAACCTQRTFTATFMCRSEQKAMNSCMKIYATQEEQDAARAEWFATMDQRREEKEKKELKRIEDEKFWKEWWAKDKKGVPSTEGRDIKGRHIDAEGKK